MPLQQLLGSINKSIFAKDYWNKKPLHISRCDKAYYDDILHFEQVSEYINRKDLRPPYLKLFKNTSEIDQVEYFSDLPVEGFYHEKLIHQITLKSKREEGALLKLDLLDRAFPSVESWKFFLEKELKFPTHLSAFLYPEELEAHPSVSEYNLFLLQVNGSTIIEIASSDQYDVSNNLIEFPEGSQREVVLEMGDLLFLPQGTSYKICRSHDNSIVLNASLVAPTWYDLINDLIENLSENHLSFRETIMPHLTGIDYEKKLSEVKGLAYSSAKFNDQFNSFKRKLPSLEITDNQGKLLDYLALSTITSETVVGPRRVNNFRLEKTEKDIKVFFNGKVLHLDLDKENAIIKIRETEQLSVAEILDVIESDQLEFIKQLIKEGFLRIYHD